MSNNFAAGVFPKSTISFEFWKKKFPQIQKLKTRRNLPRNSVRKNFPPSFIILKAPILSFMIRSAHIFVETQSQHITTLCTLSYSFHSTMKLSILAIVGAFASANAAVIRGDVAAKKLALLHQLTHVANKNTFRFARRQLEENQNGENNGVTKDTTITPALCVTATVYNSDNNDNNNGNSYANKATQSFITFNAGAAGSSAGAEYDGQYGVQDKYITSLSQYLSDIGKAYAEEMLSLCTTCANLDYYW